MELPEKIKAYFQSQGKIGAKKRMKVLSPERRSEIARNAARARWMEKSAGGKSAKSVERRPVK